MFVAQRLYTLNVKLMMKAYSDWSLTNLFFFNYVSSCVDYFFTLAGYHKCGG